MKRSMQLGVALLLVIAAMQCDLFARGFGGFHGGGYGGFHGGGYGGFHGGGSEAGGFHGGGFEAGGDRAGGFDSFHAGGSEAGGFHAAGYGGDAGRGDAYAGSVNRGSLNRGSLNRGELNSFLGMPTDGGMHAVAGAYGARGIGAGHVEQGAMGTTIAHGTAGIQAAVGRGDMAGYGTRHFSAAAYHAQGLAGQRWFAGHSLFTPAWCDAHPWGWCPAGYTAAAWAIAGWNTATWPAVGSWFPWAATPAYYDYGDNITYQNNDVYYGSQPEESQQQYYQDAVNLAGSGVAANAGNTAQWLPLGVFGLMPSGQTNPEMIFQLAVNKQGLVQGNYYDQIADSTVRVHGAVSKKNQRVAWQVGNNKNLVIETGLYNLTLDQSTALVHFGADKTEQFVLVRVKQPADGEQAQQ
jgi:hypothetical protein